MTEERAIEFAELLTSHQHRLYRYVISLLGDADAAWDVLQEANRVLLEKRAEFREGTSFVNWALTVAQFQTMAWLRDRGRDRLVATPEIVELISAEAMSLDSEVDQQQQALRTCLDELPENHRELVHLRYAQSRKLTELAKASGKTVNALKQLFFRVRGTLMHCIEKRMVTS